MLLLRRLLIALFIFFCLAGAAVGYYLYVISERQKKEHSYDHLIEIAAREHKLDPLLIRAVIWRESRFTRYARGTSGERGLMQLMTKTAQEWAKKTSQSDFKDDDLFDPFINIQAGAFTLAKGMQKWADRDNPIPFALAEYNAGRSRMQTWIDPNNPTNSKAFFDRIDYPKTRRYVWIIERKYQEYQWREQNPNWWWWPYEFLDNLTSPEDDPTVM